MTKEPIDVRSRGLKFATCLTTTITEETASPKNPYLIEDMRIHGYKHLELMEKCELSDVIYLLFRGEMPNEEQSHLFRKLCIAMINPGPRNTATQASITAGVSKTLAIHLLPISLSVYGGDFDGVGKVAHIMRYFLTAPEKPVEQVLDSLDRRRKNNIPGFDTVYGDIDPYATTLLESFDNSSSQPIIKWVTTLNNELIKKNIGITKAGVCAAVLTALGFHPEHGGALMQLIGAPGLLAHGLEYSEKSLTSMLFESDDCYEIEGEAALKSAIYKESEVTL